MHDPSQFKLSGVANEIQRCTLISLPISHVDLWYLWSRDKIVWVWNTLRIIQTRISTLPNTGIHIVPLSDHNLLAKIQSTIRKHKLTNTHQQIKMKNYNINLVEKVGGQTAFNFVVMDYCASIRNDPNIKHFFAKDADLSGPIELQNEFLNATYILDSSPQETKAAMARLTAQYQNLCRMGLKSKHFDAMKAHFLLALRSAWVEESLIQAVETQYDRLRPLLRHQESGKVVQNSIHSIVQTRPLTSLRSIVPAVNGQRRRR